MVTNHDKRKAHEEIGQAKGRLLLRRQSLSHFFYGIRMFIIVLSKAILGPYSELPEPCTRPLTFFVLDPY